MTQETAAVVQIVAVVAEAIRELGEVPSGHLYARLMGHLSLEEYQAIVGALKQTKLIEEKHHVLRWVGPK